MDEQDNVREAAIKRLKDKRDFRMHVVTYVTINVMLIGVWALTGHGYFWPVWVLGGWGVGLVLHAWTTFFTKPITEAQIEREISKGNSRITADRNKEVGMDEQEQRNVAVKQLKAKRDFRMHLGTYVIINAMMIAIWAMGDRSGFWPIWVMIPWGVGVAFHGWNTYFNKPISEAEIEREMRR